MDEPISQAGNESGTDSREFSYKLEVGLSPSHQTVPGGSQHLVIPKHQSCQCLPEGLRWVAELFSFQMLPAYPEAGDQPGAPGGHAEEEGRCQSPSQKCL